MDNGEKATESDASRHDIEESDACRHDIEESKAAAEESAEERYASVSTNVCLSPPSFLIVKYFF